MGVFPMRLALSLLLVFWFAGEKAKVFAGESAASNLLSFCMALPAAATDPSKLNTTITACSEGLSSQTLTTAEKVSILVHRGVAYRNARLLDKSLADLLDARALAPTDPVVSRMLAWTYREMRRYEDAKVEYDRALELEPSPQAYLSRCVVLIDRKEYENALPDCQTALKLHANEDAIFFTSLILLNLGRSTDAIRLLEPAIRGPRASGRTYGQLAKSYSLLGRIAEAREIESAGHERFPNDPDLSLPPPRTP
jgi:tetratricopeptide (TPR) repeat protein